MCVCVEKPPWENKNSADLKVDVAVGQPAGAALVQEVDIFNEQTEERDDDLQVKQKRELFQRNVRVKVL